MKLIFYNQYFINNNLEIFIIEIFILCCNAAKMNLFINLIN